MASLFDSLAEHGIRLRSTAPGRQEKILCPKCEGGRSRDKDLSVRIDDDGEGFTAHCFNCDLRVGVRMKDVREPTRFARKPRPPVKLPPAHTPKQIETRPDWLYEWFADRCIGARVVNAFGIYAIQHFIPQHEAERECMVFPFLFGGKVVNRKYRVRGEKTFIQEKDPLPTLFNVDSLGVTPETVIFVEGEADVMALAECGVVAVSFKDGAPQPSIDPAKAEDPHRNDLRFAALETHGNLFAKAKRILLAGDMDGPGEVWRAELARRMGRHRCLTVDWPEGCKDAGDTLKALGPDAVAAALANPTPWPIDGLHPVTPGLLSARKRLPLPAVMGTGLRPLDDIVRLPTEGRLIVVTGYPKMGKTNLIRWIMVHTIGAHGRRWAVFSPEMQPWEDFVVESSEVLTGRTFWPYKAVEQMNDEDIRRAEEYFAGRLTMLVSDAGTELPTMDWIFERAEACVMQHGTTDLWIDPWNQVSHARPANMTGTEYIGRELQRSRAFCLRHGCNIWLNAHPAKPAPDAGAKPPGPYQISDSAHWYNMSDMGLTVHRPDDGKAEVYLWASRFEKRWGEKNKMATLDFDRATGRYSAPAAYFTDVPKQPRHWQDFDDAPLFRGGE
jgi:twinkle protein